MACIVHLYLDWVLSGDDDAAGRAVAGGPPGPGVLLDPGRLGRRPRRRDGGRPAQHDGRGVLRPQSADGLLVPRRAAGLRRDGRAPGAKPSSRATAASCSRAGPDWLDDDLFNGSYYRHEVPPVSAIPTSIAPGLRHRSMGARRHRSTPTCSSARRLPGRPAGRPVRGAVLVGLGDLLDPDHVATTLRTVHPPQLPARFTHHFNHMRSFVLGDEAAVLMCTYDADKRPDATLPVLQRGDDRLRVHRGHRSAPGWAPIDEGLEIIRRHPRPLRRPAGGTRSTRRSAATTTRAPWPAGRPSPPGTTSGTTGGARADHRQPVWPAASASGRPVRPSAPGLRVASPERSALCASSTGELALDTLVVDGVPHPSPTAVLTRDTPWTVPAAARA